MVSSSCVSLSPVDAAQPLHGAADDHQKIVEVVRDAAGQLADRLEALRLAQRILCHFAALRFVMQALGALERDPQHAEQQQRGRQAEHQIGADRRQPFALDLAGLDAGERIDRKAFELAKAHAAGNAVDLGA